MTCVALQMLSVAGYRQFGSALWVERQSGNRTPAEIVLAAMEGRFESGPMAEITLICPNPTRVLPWASIGSQPPLIGLKAYQDRSKAQWPL